MLRVIFRAMCFSSMLTASCFVHAEVKIHDAWVRLLPPNVTTTAAYMEIQSTQDDALLSASSPAAAMVEVHETSMVDGMMSMSEVPELKVMAGQSIKLEPHGKHLMVMGLKKPLEAGQVLPFELNFSISGKVTVEAIVEQR